MKYTQLGIQGLLLVEPTIYSDERGYFCETYRQSEMERELGYAARFVQENQSSSCRGVLRGIHLQLGQEAQAKLVRCVVGRIIDVAVDLRVDSPTFGQHIAVELSEDNHCQLFIPRGFGHAFLSLSDRVVFQYKVDNLYAPRAECCIQYNDPQLAIDWQGMAKGVSPFILSPKDLSGISLDEYQKIVTSKPQ